jgi:hypothetical protein
MAKDPELRRISERLANLERAFQSIFEILGGPRAKVSGWKALKSDHPLEYPNDLERRRAAEEARRVQEQARYFGLLEMMSGITQDIANAGIPVRTIIPIYVYVDTQASDTVEQVDDAVEEIIADYDLESLAETPGSWGSWFKKWIVRSKDAVTSQQARDNFSRVERALEMQTLHVPQSYIDSAQSDGVAKLIAALSNTQNALIQIGSVLLIKVDGTPIVRNLTQVELAHLERNKILYKSPKDALEELSQIADDPRRFAVESGDSTIT